MSIIDTRIKEEESRCLVVFYVHISADKIIRRKTASWFSLECSKTRVVDFLHVNACSDDLPQRLVWSQLWQHPALCTLTPHPIPSLHHLVNQLYL